MRPNTPVLVGLLVLFAFGMSSCVGTRRTVHEGGFQKRKHQPGWHLDLGGRSDRRASERSTVTKPLAAQAISGPAVAISDIPQPTGPDRSLASVTSDLGPSLQPTAPPIGVELGPRIAPAHRSASAGTDQERPTKQFNPWALPAFALALGTIAYGILGTSNLVIVIAVLLTLLVAAIALKKGRTNEWSGKGFAVSAMIIGCLSALITLIALLQGGF